MSVSNRLLEGQALLESSEFGKAEELFTTLINEDPTLTEAYFGRLLAKHELRSQDDLKNSSYDISENDDFIKALTFASEDRKRELSEISDSIIEKRKILSVYDSDFLEKIYQRATDCEANSESYLKNAGVLRSIGPYRDASALAEEYEKIGMELKKKEDLERAAQLELQAKEREEKRKKSDSIQIKIYTVAIIVLSIFLIFLIAYNTFLGDYIQKKKVLDLIYPLDYDDVTIMNEDNAPWFSVSESGVLSFDISKYEGDGNIVIPDVFDNVLVVSIKNYTFKNCTQIKSVVMSDFIEEIGNGAFDSCKNLESVTLSSSLTAISPYAFANCSSLKNIVLPDYVETIDNYAFSSCTSLKEVVFSDVTAYIGKYAFQKCTSLESIVLPRQVKAISVGAFASCDSLQEVLYTGSQDDFEKISVSSGNIPFTDAEKTYGYSKKN